jgi:anaerobic dimethyl sulfoxide reductase subunit A
MEKNESYLKDMVVSTPDLPKYEKFKQRDAHFIKLKQPRVAFRRQIEDPLNHPFPTSSGKIEIFSHKIAEMKNEQLFGANPVVVR